MMPLLFIAAASADLDALDQAVTHCERAAVNPMFAGEARRGGAARSCWTPIMSRRSSSLTGSRLRTSVGRFAKALT
jgi:hypothetical protein